MKKISISIIVPVYNVEMFLSKCLETILNQTLDGIELIIIDDCSPDNSNLIINRYKSKFPALIHIVNIDNLGLGLTRNKGLEVATGEYIGFVDSDDFIEIDMFKTLLQEAIDTKSDIVGCDFKYYYDDKNVIQDNMPSDFELNSWTLLSFLIYPWAENFHPNNVWAKLYKREFLVKNDIIFESERVLYTEDQFFNICCMLFEPTLSWVRVPLYNYRIRANSLMTELYKKKLPEKYFKKVETVEVLLRASSHDLKKVLNQLEQMTFEELFFLVSNATKMRMRSYSELRCFYLELRFIKTHKFTQRAVNNFGVQDIPKSKSFINKLFKIIVYFYFKLL